MWKGKCGREYVEGKMWKDVETKMWKGGCGNEDVEGKMWKGSSGQGMVQMDCEMHSM